MDDNAPVGRALIHVNDSVPLRFRRAGNVPGAFRIVEEQFDLAPARERLDVHLGFRPAQRTPDAPQVEVIRHKKSRRIRQPGSPVPTLCGLVRACYSRLYA